MFQRLNETASEIRKMGKTRVLDVGCGTGVFSVALVRAGATCVLRVDFSKSMVELAVRRAVAAGLSSRCKFVEGDFRLLQFSEPFDCCIAIGVFDYLAEPKPFLEHMRRVTK